MATIVTMPIRGTTRQGRANAGGGYLLVTLCLLVLSAVYQILVLNRDFSRIGESSIRDGDYDYDDDDGGEGDLGGGAVGAEPTMRSPEGRSSKEGSSAANPTTAADSSNAHVFASPATASSSSSPPRNSDAPTQSYGFFYDVSDDSWDLLRDIYLKHENHIDPSRPLLYSEHDPKSTQPWDGSAAAWYQNNYEPNFSCMFEKRIGGIGMNGDGPKWVRVHRHRACRLIIESAILFIILVGSSKHIFKGM